MLRARIVIAVFIVSLLAAMVAAPAAAQDLTGGCSLTHRVHWGENLFRISLRYGKTVGELVALNGLTNGSLIYAGQVLCITGGIVPPPPPPQGTPYVVRSGDTLGRIARNFGVDLYMLARVNNIANINVIYVGQTLIIPNFTTQ